MTAQPTGGVRHVNLSFTVPVQVVVDLDEGAVTRVVVIDEAVVADPGTYHADYATGHQLPADHPAVAAGYALAEAADIEWPSWQFGW